MSNCDVGSGRRGGRGGIVFDRDALALVLAGAIWEELK